MGGRGSGRIFRWDKKTSLEECRFIDVRDWKRRGLLANGSGFSWYWMRDGERVADIRVSDPAIGSGVLSLQAERRRVA